jgi:hypothetical protein
VNGADVNGPECRPEFGRNGCTIARERNPVFRPGQVFRIGSLSMRDLIITGGLVADGSGAPRQPMDHDLEVAPRRGVARGFRPA